MRPCYLKQKVYLTEPPPTLRSANHDEQRTAPGAVGRAGKSAEGASLHSSAVCCCKKAADQDEGSPPEGRKAGLCDFQKTSRWLVPSLGALAVSATDEPKTRLPMQPNAAPVEETGQAQAGQGIDDLRERGWLELTGF